MVSDVLGSSQAPDVLAAAPELAQHVVHLISVHDDGFGETLDVVWELEPARRIVDVTALPEPRAGRFDPPARPWAGVIEAPTSGDTLKRVGVALAIDFAADTWGFLREATARHGCTGCYVVAPTVPGWIEDEDVVRAGVHYEPIERLRTATATGSNS